MSFLLDTHTFLWWLFDDPGLSATVRGIVSDPETEILVSSASAWEIATKHRLGRLPAADQLVQDIPGWVQRAGFRDLPIELSDAQRAGSFPQAHRDPFDRMLAAQSLTSGCALLSRDPELDQFGIQRVW